MKFKGIFISKNYESMTMDSLMYQIEYLSQNWNQLFALSPNARQRIIQLLLIFLTYIEIICLRYYTAQAAWT